ncbi:hypothetical protein BV25DRAFT_1325802 [Artomyces pyxidatus]|uniref:Uncharacterized protein n=1 Tax=Artomyces pyxidatus TaxID=48021 RepID=A0ACB8SP70_9AGAM|nr:hypothetical protein BV25DRAFT_1325802 [Artomyces pyxidatus]
MHLRLRSSRRFPFAYAAVLNEWSGQAYIDNTGGGRPNYSREDVVQRLGEPGPYLEDLTLQQTVVPNLLGGQVPTHLRRLRLFDMHLHPTACILRAPMLSVLEIRNTFIWEDRTRLLEGLRSLPNLEILVLDTFENGMSGDRDPPAQPRHSIPLPRLKYLQIRDVVSDELMNCIQMPSNVVFSVAVEVDDVPRGDQWHPAQGARMHSHIPSHVLHAIQFSVLNIHPFRTYENNALPGIGFTVGMQIPGSQPTAFPPSFPPKLTYIMEWCHPWANLNHVENRISRLANCFLRGVQQVTLLQVTHNHFEVPGEWASISRKCKVVQWIIAGDRAASGLVTALLHQSQATFFPRLSTLGLLDANLGGPIGSNLALIDGVMRAIELRTRSTVRVLRLVLEACEVSAQQVQVLQDHGQRHGYQVIWDRRTRRIPVVLKGHWEGREEEAAQLLAGNYTIGQA